MRHLLCAAAAATSVLVAGPVHAAAWTATPYDHAGDASQLWGVNDSGVLVGLNDDGGFIDTHGSVQTVNGPAGPGTLTGISDGGVAVGNGGDGSSFFYQGGVFTPFAVTGGTDTLIRSISSNGRYVAGTYRDASSNFFGFVWDRDTSTLSTIAAPGGTAINVVQGVNDDGVATGSLDNGEALIYDSSAGTSSYFGSSGDLTDLRFRAIDDAGLVGGWATEPDGVHVGIIGTPAGGFTTFSLGDGGQTVVYGLNNVGEAVGFYFDSDDIEHSFIATSAGVVPEPSSTALLIAGLAAVAWRSGRPKDRQRRAG